MSNPVTAELREPRRPFPWFCPRCRRKDVRPAVIAYECERFLDGKPVTVVVPEFTVPKCGNCGELVFDYDAEEQINRAFAEQTSLLAPRPNGVVNPVPSHEHT